MTIDAKKTKYKIKSKDNITKKEGTASSSIPVMESRQNSEESSSYNQKV